MGILKNSNKIGGAKYLLLVRCVLLLPHSRTGLHWSGVSGSHHSELKLPPLAAREADKTRSGIVTIGLVQL